METAIAPTQNNQVEANTPAPVIVQSSGNGKVIAWVLGIGVVAVGGYFAKRAWDKYQQDKRTQALPSDPHAVLAKQIAAEVQSYPANDDVIINLFKQITDFGAVAKAYRADTGKDIIEHVRANVGDTAFRQITNLVGYSGGTKAPQKQQTKDVVAKSGLFITVKGDGYIRKSPIIPTCSRFVPDALCYRENVISEVKGGEYIGRSTANNLTKQAEFTDKKSGVIFIEVEVTDKSNTNKKYKGYIAASNANTHNKYDTHWTWRKIDANRYNMATAPLSGLGSINTLL